MAEQTNTESNNQKAPADHIQVMRLLDQIRNSDPDIYAILAADELFELLERRNVDHPLRSKAVAWLLNEHQRLRRERDQGSKPSITLFSKLRTTFQGYK